MLGAGVFAAFAPAARAAGAALLVGLALAAVVAYANATSTARLAAALPTSGGACLRPGPARPRLGFPRRLVLHRRQDRQLRCHGAHVRGVPRPRYSHRWRSWLWCRWWLSTSAGGQNCEGHGGDRGPGAGRARPGGCGVSRAERRRHDGVGRHRRVLRGAAVGGHPVLRLRRLCPYRHPGRGGPRPTAHDPAGRAHRARPRAGGLPGHRRGGAAGSRPAAPGSFVGTARGRGEGAARWPVGPRWCRSALPWPRSGCCCP